LPTFAGERITKGGGGPWEGRIINLPRGEKKNKKIFGGGSVFGRKFPGRWEKRILCPDWVRFCFRRGKGGAGGNRTPFRGGWSGWTPRGGGKFAKKGGFAVPLGENNRLAKKKKPKVPFGPLDAEKRGTRTQPGGFAEEKWDLGDHLYRLNFFPGPHSATDKKGPNLLRDQSNGDSRAHPAKPPNPGAGKGFFWGGETGRADCPKNGTVKCGYRARWKKK